MKSRPQAEKLLSNGHDLEYVYEKIGVDEDTLKNWADHLSLPSKPEEVFSSCTILKAVLPVFTEDFISSNLKHIGSGVLLRIGNELFVLTAAHVIDHGTIFMPAVDEIEQITGGFSFNPIPEHGSRAKDPIDIGYIHLSNDWLRKLHPEIKPLSVDDLLLIDELETGDIFTFVGYPWRKTKSSASLHKTDLTTFTGHASASDIYNKLSYNRVTNVLIRMRRKKTYSSRYESHQTAPHPQGISGGAVIAWPWNFIDRHDSTNLKLAAIGHTYHEREHCMVATRIIPYMMAIVRNNPELAMHFAGLEVNDEFGLFLSTEQKMGQDF
ncbi:hypothetical protein CA11_36610 [Gimesia maris]|uniref:hypothetical protein n=1 Tax=Gimesia maris TaxID=122 RepID=UPI00118B88EC|nr:hypothetical protein [Gimesia maris]QDU15833.1 hypothetical protein CA11_36610 [Gimesia maris]